MWIQIDAENNIIGYGTKQEFFDIEVPDGSLDNLKFPKYNRTTGECQEDVLKFRNYLLDQIEYSVESFMETTARKKGYSNQNRLLSYVDDPNPLWDSEARAFRAWRSSVWQYCIAARGSADENTPLPEIEQFIETLLQECPAPW